MNKKRVLLSFLSFPAALLLTPLLIGEEKVDLYAVHRIRTEALQNSKVMDHVFYFTDVCGPRLTGSPGFQKSADWTVKQLRQWGCKNVRFEKWGQFGRSWTFVRYTGHLIEPLPAPLIGFPLAWSPGTNGPLAGEPILAPMPLRGEPDFEKTLKKYKGKLRGKMVMIDAPRQLGLHSKPFSHRWTDSELAAEALAPDPRPESPFASPIPRKPPDSEEIRKRRKQRIEFLKKEGALMVITRGSRGDNGTIFATYAGWREPNYPLPPPTVAIAVEHYNRIARLLNKKIPVRLEFDIQTRFHEDDLDGFNVIAEIPGQSKKDEVVMIGAHLDSWIAGTGATDNAAGSAVMLEVMRILKKLDLKMDRTVRLALWSAEEGGLFGSKAYVKQHFADPKTMALKPEHAKLAAYFNVDNGSGKIRGVFLQGNDMVRPIFQAWLEPFRDLGATTLTIRNTGGTDHLPFDAVGLPGFQFIQDRLEYQTVTHHSNMYFYDHVQGGDLMQASAIVASFVYHAATREEMLPRKSLPKPKKQEKKDQKDAPSSGSQP
jgi:hypothetical protein